MLKGLLCVVSSGLNKYAMREVLLSPESSKAQDGWVSWQVKPFSRGIQVSWLQHQCLGAVEQIVHITHGSNSPQQAQQSAVYILVLSICITPIGSGFHHKPLFRWGDQSSERSQKVPGAHSWVRRCWAVCLVYHATNCTLSPVLLFSAANSQEPPEPHALSVWPGKGEQLIFHRFLGILYVDNHVAHNKRKFYFLFSNVYDFSFFFLPCYRG